MELDTCKVFLYLVNSILFSCFFRCCINEAYQLKIIKYFY